MSPIIEISQLTKKYSPHKSYRDILFHLFNKKQITALANVNLQVNAGESFALIGPNGAGKTTLIKILSTLIIPTSGSARIKGVDVLKNSATVKKYIGYVVSDERSFYWRLTGRQNLEFFAKLNNLSRKECKRKILELLKIVNLQDDANKMVKDYSSGMRQKLAIARGLINDAEILFMDEPFKNLDPIIAQSLQKFIANKLVKEKGKTVFWTTHNLKEAETSSTRLGIIKNGALKFTGTVKELEKRAEAKQRIILRLAASEQIMSKIIKQINIVKTDESSSIEITPKVKELEIEAREDEVASLIDKIVHWGASVLACYPKEISIDEAYNKILAS